VSSQGWSTAPFRYGIGVFQGCTMSTILFNIVFNLLYEWLKNCVVEPYVMEDGLELRDGFFADDVGFVTVRPRDNQQLLHTTDDFIEWTKCMAAKPPKCKSLAFCQFKPGSVHRYVPYEDKIYSAFDPELTISGQPLEFIADKPFKYLGRKVYASLDESIQRADVEARLQFLLETVDGKPILGMMKAWLYNNAVVPQLSWPILVYDFPMSFIEDLDAMANRYIKPWFGLPLHGPNPVIIYLPKDEKGLGMTKLTHYFMSMGVVREHLLKYSGDPCIRRLAEFRLARAEQNEQKKWTAACALRDAERGLVLDSMMAAGQTSRHGIGVQWCVQWCVHWFWVTAPR
jgi:hypothetical protein